MGGYVGCPDAVRDLWPRPALGLDAVTDSLKPMAVPGADRPSQSQAIHRAHRGVADYQEYVRQTYDVGQDRITTRSLGRSMVYSILEAMFRTGGPHYPKDYGFGPGAHYDCMSPQWYMRPGVAPLHQAIPASNVGPVTNQGRPITMYGSAV